MSLFSVSRFASLVAGAALLFTISPMQSVQAAGSETPFWTMPWDSSSTSSSSSSSFFGGLFGGNSTGGKSGRHVVSFSPNIKPGQIIVSFSDRRLYYVNARGRAISYPIAAPRPQSRWQGSMRISRKTVNPVWTPTAEMRAENPRLPASVPGGHPRNPLGYRAMYLGSSLYRIHGTDAPWTIGQPVSRGCIRMYNADVADLYNRVPVGTKVTVTFNRFASASAW